MEGEGVVGTISGKEATYSSMHQDLPCYSNLQVFIFVSENTQNVFMLSTFTHKLAVTCFFLQDPPGSSGSSM